MNKVKGNLNVGTTNAIKLTDKHKYNTRLAATSNYFMPQPRTNLGLMSFSYVGPKLWQDVPLNIKNLNASQFKSKYKKILLNRYTMN